MITEAEQQKLHEEDLERLKSKPVHTARPGRDTFTEHGVESYKQIPNSRHYAADLDFANALGATAQAFCEIVLREKHKGFVRSEFAKEVLEPLTQLFPELRQDRPGKEEPLPAWPVDDNGLKIANPYMKGSIDLASQAQLQEKHPELAAWMKQIAEHGGAPTFAMLVKRQDEREAREKLRSLKYHEATHRSNPFLLDTKTGLKPRSEFVRANPEFVTKFYQREATTPMRLPFQSPANLTQLMQVQKHSSELANVIDRANEIYREWRAADMQRLRELNAANEAELKKLETATAR
jgi:hypothetical protein